MWLFIPEAVVGSSIWSYHLFTLLRVAVFWLLLVCLDPGLGTEAETLAHCGRSLGPLGAEGTRVDPRVVEGADGITVSSLPLHQGTPG